MLFGALSLVGILPLIHFFALFLIFAFFLKENNLVMKSIWFYSKDHIEKIDFQELIFAVVNWPNSELYGAFVCIICYIG